VDTGVDQPLGLVHQGLLIDGAGVSRERRGDGDKDALELDGLAGHG
jgi:hypothetical protein